MSEHDFHTGEVDFSQCGPYQCIYDDETDDTLLTKIKHYSGIVVLFARLSTCISRVAKVLSAQLY
jgi:hypothetical protein